MYVCTNCGHVFTNPAKWQERHGFTHGPFESFSGCPKCNEPFVEAHICDCCEEFISGDYIKTEDGKRYCSNCFVPMALGDED